MAQLRQNPIPASVGMACVRLDEHTSIVKMLGQMDAASLILEEEPAARSGSVEANCWPYKSNAPRSSSSHVVLLTDKICLEILSCSLAAPEI